MSCNSHYSDESCSGCSEASPGTCPSCATDRKVCDDCGRWLECEGTCGETADCRCPKGAETDRDEMTCHHCGNGDHFARECPLTRAARPSYPAQMAKRKPARLTGLVLVLGLFGCTDEGAAARGALADMGYSNVRLTTCEARDWAKDDDSCTRFEGVGPAGARARGVVGCSYVFKGCAVRMNKTEEK